MFALAAYGVALPINRGALARARPGVWHMKRFDDRHTPRRAKPESEAA